MTKQLFVTLGLILVTVLFAFLLAMFAIHNGWQHGTLVQLFQHRQGVWFLARLMFYGAIIIGWPRFIGLLSTWLKIHCLIAGAEDTALAGIA